jgi:hypothetical protein
MERCASRALKELKEFLTKPPVLTALDPGEVLLLYIAAAFGQHSPKRRTRQTRARLQGATTHLLHQ